MKYPTAYNEDYGKQTAVTLSVFGGLLLVGVTAGQVTAAALAPMLGTTGGAAAGVGAAAGTSGATAASGAVVDTLVVGGVAATGAGLLVEGGVAGGAASAETSAAAGADAAGAGRAALAARFGTTAERTAVLERAITAEGGLNTSTTVARQLAGQRSFIPTQSVLDTIGSGARVADPQGVAGQFMYRSAASFNGSQGTLEVLVHEASGQIRHVLFRSGVAP
jgi:hypothetical protein